MDYSKETFPLNHFVLYCKGWYEPVDKNMSKIDFISKILSLDGYIFARSLSEILNLLFAKIDVYNEWLKDHNYSYMDFQRFYLQSKDNARLYDCSLEEAMLITIRHFFHTKSREEIVLQAPVYSRKLYKNGITLRYKNPGETYKERNDYAYKTFNS